MDKLERIKQLERELAESEHSNAFRGAAIDAALHQRDIAILQRDQWRKVADELASAHLALDLGEASQAALSAYEKLKGQP